MGTKKQLPCTLDLYSMRRRALDNTFRFGIGVRLWLESCPPVENLSGLGEEFVGVGVSERELENFVHVLAYMNGHVVFDLFGYIFEIFLVFLRNHHVKNLRSMSGE